MNDPAERPADRPPPPVAADSAPAPQEWGLRLALAVLGFTSVGSLLAWVYGLGPFDVWFRALTLPGMGILAAIGVLSTRVAGLREARAILVVGAIAGLVGTLGYDVFRVPFVVVGGFKLLSPIESYGVLALGAETSSGWSDFVGWTYHVSNGVGFGVAYAALALRRHWGWGVLYAMLLETGTILTPFAGLYDLHGKYFVIFLAYAAHVPYGLALGWLTQRPDATMRNMAALGRHSVPVVLVGTVAGLALWLRPWSLDGDIEAGRDVTVGPSIVVSDGRISPEFVVADAARCITVGNADSEPVALHGAPGTPVVAAGDAAVVCFDDDGVHHLKPDDRPFRGSFVIVDPQRENP